MNNYDKEEDDATDLYIHGCKKLSVGDYQGAIEDFNKALVYDRTDVQIYIQRANAKFHSKDYSGCIDDCIHVYHMRKTPVTKEIAEKILSCIMGKQRK